MPLTDLRLPLLGALRGLFISLIRVLEQKSSHQPDPQLQLPSFPHP
jgi:hypothetical protein